MILANLTDLTLHEWLAVLWCPLALLVILYLRKRGGGMNG